MDTPIKDLCKGFPEEFGTYLEYCRNLKFGKTPDYKYLRNLFYGLFRRKGFKDDCIYDWMNLKEYQTTDRSPAKYRLTPQPALKVPPLTLTSTAKQSQGVSLQSVDGSSKNPTSAIRKSKLRSSTGPSHSVPSTSVIPGSSSSSLKKEAGTSKQESQDLLEAYSVMEAERDKWKRKCEEYQRQIQSLKAQNVKLRRTISLAYSSQQMSSGVAGVQSSTPSPTTHIKTKRKINEQLFFRTTITKISPLVSTNNNTNQQQITPSESHSLGLGASSSSSSCKKIRLGDDEEKEFPLMMEDEKGMEGEGKGEGDGDSVGVEPGADLVVLREGDPTTLSSVHGPSVNHGSTFGLSVPPLRGGKDPLFADGRD